MKNTVENPTDIELNSVVSMKVELLKLDRRNPRLQGVADSMDDVDIISKLYLSEDLGELLQSISANGYMDIEPLIVMQEDLKYIVLEGNRRLASIRLFREPYLANQIFERDGIKISIPKIPEEHRDSLEQVSVYGVANREDARSYIGFKHINGAAKWDSYAKAKFASEWYLEGGVSFTEIAARIGDKHDTVKRMVNAIFVLEQAENAGVFRVSNRVNPKFSFSHLYTALSRANVMRFLGMDSTWVRFDPEPNPISQDKVAELKEILIWIYGSKEDNIRPVVQSQNPDLKNLAEVIDNVEGLIVLRETHSLSEALASIQPRDSKFSEALIKARSEIRTASNNLRGFDGLNESLIEIAQDVSEIAETIVDRMRKKWREAKEDRDR